MGLLLVVRHAQASLFAANYDQLSERGREQAGLLGRSWREAGDARVEFTRLVTGPAQRHIDTAALARAACFEGESDPWPQTERIPAFDEHDAFSLVRRAIPDLMQRDERLAHYARKAQEAGEPAARSAAWQGAFEIVMAGWLAGEVQVEGVESWPEFDARVSGGLEQLLAEATESAAKQRIVLFTSVGPTAVILKHALRLDPLDAFRTAWRQRNCSRSDFLFRRDELTLDSFNRVDHLPPELHTHR